MCIGVMFSFIVFMCIYVYIYIYTYISCYVYVTHRQGGSGLFAL